MCAQLNPLAHIYYKKWKEVVENRGGKVFAAVVENGTVWTNGDKPFFAKYLAQAEIQERRDSGAWIPPAPLPKLPRKLPDMMDYKVFAEVKRTSKLFLHHFLLPGQLIGEVCFNFYCV